MDELQQTRGMALASYTLSLVLLGRLDPGGPLDGLSLNDVLDHTLSKLEGPAAPGDQSVAVARVMVELAGQLLTSNPSGFKK